MELFLNLIWLAVALASAAKFARWVRGADRRRAIAVATATVCTLALLFPIISITDDLHMKKAVVEEAKTIALVPVTGIVTFALAVVASVAVATFALPLSPAAPAFVERGPPV